MFLRVREKKLMSWSLTDTQYFPRILQPVQPCPMDRQPHDWAGITGLSERLSKKVTPPCESIPWPGGWPNFLALPRSSGRM